MKDSLLYIGESIKKASNGGDVVNNRNIAALKACFGNGFYHYELFNRSRLITFLRLILGFVGFVGLSDLFKISSFIKKNNIDIIFLWSSKLGRVAKYIKRRHPNVQVVTFFHNVEKQYYAEESKVTTGLKLKLIKHVVCKNESDAVEYSDTLITLNDRDSNLLDIFYGKKASFNLPTTFEDKYDENKALFYATQKDKTFDLLFVGYNFYANVEGLRWFIENVLPELSNVRLTIVGKDMEQAFHSENNIRVHGFVKDLSEYYYRTDIVVLPIFIGGGMKTKTAEALMYGTAIVGTSEAFEGYDLEYDKIGGLADDAEKMIEHIKRLQKSHTFVETAKSYSRSVFLEKYSLSSTIEKVAKELCHE